MNLTMSLTVVQSVSVCQWDVNLVSPTFLFLSLQNNCNSIESLMHFLFPHYSNYKMGQCFDIWSEQEFCRPDAW